MHPTVWFSCSITNTCTFPHIPIRDTACFTLATPSPHTVALDQVPPAEQLHQVHQPGDLPNPVPAHSTLSITHLPSEKATTSLYIGGRMPPISAKLAKRIQDGQFVEKKWSNYCQIS